MSFQRSILSENYSFADKSIIIKPNKANTKITVIFSISTEES